MVARKKRKLSIAKRTSKFLASNSLARKFSKAKKKITRRSVSKYKKTVRATKRVKKKAVRSKKQIIRSLKRGRKRTTKALKSTKRYLRARKRAKATRIRDSRRAERAAIRAATRMELTGSVDITGASVTQASEDRGASRPGEPPKMRTGKGRDSIKAELNIKGKKLQSRVYVEKKIANYMAMWEFRKDGKGRPFLKPSIMNNKNTFGSIIGAEMKSSIPSRSKQKAVVK